MKKKRLFLNRDIAIYKFIQNMIIHEFHERIFPCKKIFSSALLIFFSCDLFSILQFTIPEQVKKQQTCPRLNIGCNKYLKTH